MRKSPQHLQHQALLVHLFLVVSTMAEIGLIKLTKTPFSRVVGASVWRIGA